MAGYCYIQTSNHEIARNLPIQSQGHIQAPIVVGDDCWLGGGVFILSGVTLGKGVVVGANSLVNNDVGDYNIVAGTPAKVIGERN